MRKELTVQISEEGRDQGKCFLIREMPAKQAERWAIRVLLAVGKAGVDVPEDIQMSGMAGLFVMGFGALMKISFEDAEPLLNEMLQCVSLLPNPNDRKVSRPLIDDGVSDDIEEVATLLKLRREVFQLHVNFSKVGAALTRMGT